jgi:hypothetical protein
MVEIGQKAKKSLAHLPGVCPREAKADPVKPALWQGQELVVLRLVPNGRLLGVLV